MCNNIIVLYTFIIIKIIVLVILPVIILIKRKKEYCKILILVEVFLLAFFLLCNIFTINKCVYNSTPDGIKRTNIDNKISLFDRLHPLISYGQQENISEKKYKTLTSKTLYYYNQNRDNIKNLYFECSGNKKYMDEIGSSITSLSIAISTLYNNEVNPTKIYDYYKKDNFDFCSDITIEKVYASIVKRYGAITLSEINRSQIENSLVNDGIVIAQLRANENSKLTCDAKYIVIYSKDLSGKYSIADPTLRNSDYVCPYSSEAYGNVIDSDNMNKAFTLDEIDNEAVKYYLVKKG